MLGCFHGLSLDNIAKLAQITIALVNLVLAFYLFSYQRDKDKKAEFDTAVINARSIRLQWFKELIIQPNKQTINDFFSALETLRVKILSDDLTDEQILELNRFINEEASKLRRSFYDVILVVDKALYDQIKENIDSLVTTLTEAVSNDEHKLTNAKTFDKVILTPIQFSQHNLTALIYNYVGNS